MIDCPRCQTPVHPMQELMGPGRVVNVCPKCSTALAAPASDVTASITPVQAAQVVRQLPGDWQDMLRGKRALLRVEVEALEAKRAELNKLDRMLALLDASEESPCS